jgi:hypothetical protein
MVRLRRICALPPPPGHLVGGVVVRSTYRESVQLAKGPRHLLGEICRPGRTNTIKPLSGSASSGT